MVGGTSIGAFMGALYCIDSDLDAFETKARQFSDVRLFLTSFCLFDSH